jgi:hypothetical protein
MGAKNWILVYSDGNPRTTLASKPALDRARSEQLVRRLFPDATLTPDADGDLSLANPRDGDILVGCYGDVSIVAAEEFGLDYPSKLDPHFLKEGSTRSIHLRAMHSVVDWTAFAVWRNGEVIRSLSLSPDSGVLEDIGPRMEFEEPFWAGEHPVGSPVEVGEGFDYPFVFHPLELGEAALNDFFGYQLEGFITPDMLEPADIRLLCFKRAPLAVPQTTKLASWIAGFLSSLFGQKPKG